MTQLEDGAHDAVREIIEALPEGAQPGLLADLSQAEVEDRNGMGSIIGFLLPAYKATDERGKLLPVEGVVLDTDGAPVDVMLWVDGNDRLYELELVHYTPGNHLELNWGTFRLIT